LSSGKFQSNLVQANIPISLTEGIGTVKGSLNALLNSIQPPNLPTCASFQVLAFAVVDPDGNTFAVPGLFTP